ncbi:MAG: hypothetical protein LUI87_17505 [Lachnospiraceae bacterium]|nr:hypothetical protein [Lachnospiraceae bacterium]
MIYSYMADPDLAQTKKKKRDTLKKGKGKTDITLKEADLRKAEWFGSVTAVLLIVLSIFFMSGLLQNFWVLRFIQILGILMNLVVFLISVVRKNAFATAISLLLLVGEAAVIIYFII